MGQDPRGKRLTTALKMNENRTKRKGEQKYSYRGAKEQTKNVIVQTTVEEIGPRVHALIRYCV